MRHWFCPAIRISLPVIRGRVFGRMLRLVSGMCAMLMFFGAFTSCTGGLVRYRQPVAAGTCYAVPQIKSYNVDTIAVLPLKPSAKKETGDYTPLYATRYHQPIPKYWHLPDDGVVIANEVERQLIQSGKFRLADRRKLNQVLKEISLQQTGLVSDKDMAKIGRITGAKAIITGEVTMALAALNWQSYGDVVYSMYVGWAVFQLRMTDVETGEVIWTCSVSRNTLNYVDGKISISSTDDINQLAKYGGPGEPGLVMYVIQKAAEEMAGKLVESAGKGGTPAP